MKRPFSFILMLFLVIAGLTQVFGQGTLVGVVTDSLTEKPLIGANLYFEEMAIGASTDMDGTYRIDGVPEGSYTMIVAYLGYRSTKKSVTVVSGKRIVVNAKLIYDVIEGDEVVITAQAEGQVAAINQQITSNTIVNVVSEERIQELPDANGAEAVGRLPGVALQRSGGEANTVILRGLSPQYSSISIDGVRMASTGDSTREVDLSTISQRSLAGIELYKALTPDQDADAIAGGLNFVTKKAPSRRSITLDMRGSYNQMEKAYDQYDGALKYGERFFDGKLGVQLGGNLERRIRSQEHIDVDYDTWYMERTWELRDLQLDYRDEIRKRQGISTLLDFETPDGGLIKLNTIYSRTKRDYTTFYRNYPVGDDLFYSARSQQQEISTFNSFLKGNNYLLGLNTEWNFSYAQAKSSFPFDYEMNFEEPSTLDQVTKEPVSKMKPISNEALQGQPGDLIPYALNNFNVAYLYSAYYREEESKDNGLSGALNLSKDYALGKWFSGQFKFGGKYRQKDKIRTRSELLSPYYNYPFPSLIRLPDGTTTAKSFVGTRFENLRLTGNGRVPLSNFLDQTPVDRNVFDQYRLFPLMNGDALEQWWALNKDGVGSIGSEYQRNNEVDATYYDVTERISAGYAMNTFNFGRKVSLIAGVRVESENNDYKSRYSPNELFSYPAPTGIINDTSATHKETVWLPNAHLTFRPFSFMSLRIAAYRALARPDFNRRLESFVARQGGFLYSGSSLIIGNPALRSAKAWNFEVNSSLYESNFGLFSMSAFYKDIKDMFHLMNSLPFKQGYPLDSLGISWNNPFQTGFSLTYPFNSKKPTHVWGFETEVQTYLRYLPGLLKNIVINGNLSIVRSETYIPGVEVQSYYKTIPGFPFPVEDFRTVVVERKQKLENQPELFGNLAIGYDIGGLSVRLSVFHQGEYNTTFSSDGTSDGVRDSYTRWDLAVKHQLNRHIAVFMNVNNLTNTKEGTSLLNRRLDLRFLNQRETYGTVGDMGLRVTL